MQLSETVDFYDKSIRLMDEIIIPMLINRNRIKFHKFTVFCTKESVPAWYKYSVVVSKGLYDLYIDFSLRESVYIPISINAAKQSPYDNNIRIFEDLITKSWEEKRAKIVSERDNIEACLTDSDKYYDAILQQRELNNFLRDTPRAIFTFIK